MDAHLQLVLLASGLLAGGLAMLVPHATTKLLLAIATAVLAGVVLLSLVVA